MKNEKFFVVGLDFRNGEDKNYEHRVVKAEDIEEARGKVDNYLSTYWGKETEVKTSRVDNSKSYYAPKGYPAVEVDGFEEIDSFEELARIIGFIE